MKVYLRIAASTIGFNEAMNFTLQVSHFAIDDGDPQFTVSVVHFHPKFSFSVRLSGSVVSTLPN